MSTRININEVLEINNTNEETLELVSVIKPYIEQINGMIELRDLNIFRLYLSADDESVEVKNVECYEPDNSFVIGNGFAGQRQVTHSVIPKDHMIFAILDKLTEAKNITIEMEYSILHDAYTSVYGANFFDLHLRNMHELLSPYVSYKGCMNYEEFEYDENISIYIFDESHEGYQPFERCVIGDAEKRNWSVCNFIFSVSVENEVERNNAIKILEESFSEFDFEDPDYDEDCVWIETNYFLRDYRISDFIIVLNKATENISCIDSEPYASLSVFSTADEYIAARIYTENGEIVTDWCC